MAVKRSFSTDVDVEGRPCGGQWRTIAVVGGHLAASDVDDSADGRIVATARYRALLEPVAQIQPSDLLWADGQHYRVQAVTPRVSPFGGTHHLSVELVPADALPANTFTEPFGAAF